MATLFQIVEQHRSLLALAESDSDLDQQMLADTLEGLEGELTLKVQSVGRVIAHQEAMAKAMDEAAANISIRAKRLRARMDSLKQYLLVNMQAANLPKVDSPELVVSLKKNPPSVVVFDESQVPEEFKRTPPPAPPPVPVPDKTAIKEALKAGQDVPGCRLEQGMRVEVK